jgi:hypothetical protein
MPDPDRLLRTLAKAAEAFRTTPGRRGRLVALDGAADVLAGGDLHGHVPNFQKLFRLADLGNHPGRHLVLQEVVHGPFRYPDGGDKSHQLLDLVAALKCQFPRQVHFLPGNHELSQVTDRAVLKDNEDLNELFVRGVRAAYGDKADAVDKAYRELIAVVPMALRTPNRVFLSHSLPPAPKQLQFDPQALERDTQATDVLPGGSLHSLVWGRDTSPLNVNGFLRRVDADLLVTGHIPSDEGFAVPNERQIILDCKGEPAGYCLFPADRPLTHAELVACVKTL